ncbi:phage major capsid protein [Mongoliimonas terrestris]|uniref:phage major capsid protein n=1 Tax=Mongoliimonas terrestris TaxID=1709001 RepID=UPI000949A5FA|nr:phage major capsid protein [Mongoliimonas terrestris]
MSFAYKPDHFGAIALKSAEDDSDIITKALGDLQASVTDKLAAAQARMDKLEAKLNRPAIVTDTKAGDDLELKAFASYLRTGRVEHDLKALMVSAGSGGILAPDAYRATVLQKVAEFSPIRGLAQTVQMSGALLEIPRLVDEVPVGEVAEGGTKPEAEPSFESIDVKPFENAVIVPVSQHLVEDAAIDILSFVANHLGTKFGQRESRNFVLGNGTTQAEGVLTSAEIGVFNAADVTITADDLIDTFYSIKSPYAARGAWLMSRGTMAAVRKLKDTDGAYLWQPALASGQPPTLLGRPVYEAVDMPAVAANATPIVFGDFASGYLIADRIDLQMVTDALTGFNTGVVKIGARRRVGGRVILGEALTKLKLAAS